MWKKLFTPVGMLLFFYLPYTACAVYSYVKTESVAFLAAFFLLAAFGALYYTLSLRGKKELNKRLHWKAAGIGAAVTVLGALFNEFFLDGGILLNFIFLTSIPVVYNVMGVAYLTAESEKGNLMAYLAGALIIPFALYLVIVISSAAQIESVAIYLVICGYYFLIFMLAHIFFIFIKRNAGLIAETTAARAYYFISFALGIFLPLTGLIINQNFFGAGGGMFGDFSHPAFYIIAIINGALLIIPPVKNMRIRFILFFLRAAGFTYVCYFCVAFMPVLPYGLLGLIILLGLYVFSPYFLLIWQAKILINDWLALKTRFNSSALAVVLIAGLIAIPAGLYACVYNDRANLQKAIAYVTDNPEDKYEKVDTNALKRSLKYSANALAADNSRRMEFFEWGRASGDIPVLSYLYAEFLTDGSVISQANVDTMQNIFLGVKPSVPNTQRAQAADADILSFVKTETYYDEEIQAYRTWVNLELSNSETNLAEYITSFELPEGVFISDYYLYVGDEKKFGLLTDERAALFVYNRIVSKNRDPGLLRYISGNTLELRVFPFAPNEVRRTGFELLHKQSFNFTLDGTNIAVKGDNNFLKFTTEGAVILSAEAIEKLPVFDRTPKYSFIIDCSKGSDVLKLKGMVKEYANRNAITDANIFFTSYRAEKAELLEIENINAITEGGFNLRQAFRQIYNVIGEGEFPVILIVSEDIENAVKPFYTQAGLYPESQYYYLINDNMSLSCYRLADNTMIGEASVPEITKAALYNGIAVKRDGQSHIVITGETKNAFSKNRFENALIIKAESMSNEYNNEPNAFKNIEDSFNSRILTRGTAFIVVETQEQENEILKMQEKLLNGTAPESGTEKNMSEPPVFIALIAVALLYFYKPVKKRVAG